MICNCLFIFAMFFGCKSPQFAHISYKEKQIFDLGCNQVNTLINTIIIIMIDFNFSIFEKNCACSQSTFQPVCSPDGHTNYFSPCFAGCSLDHTTYNSTSKIYVSNNRFFYSFFKSFQH